MKKPTLPKSQQMPEIPSILVTFFAALSTIIMIIMVVVMFYCPFKLFIWHWMLKKMYS